MAKETMIVFVYDTEMCKEEADDPVSAVLYFHPSWVSDAQKLSLCGQLMGTYYFLADNFTKPTAISLHSGKFVLKDFGRFILFVGTDRHIPESILQRRADVFESLIRFYHKDIQTIYDSFENSPDQAKKMSEKLYLIFEMFLPLLSSNGTVLQNMPFSKLPRSGNIIFMEALQILQYCQQTKGILGGTIMYHNKVIASQLSPETSKNLVLTDPYHIKIPAQQIPVNYHVPIGVHLMVAYIKYGEYKKLLADAERTQQALAQSAAANQIIPFQFKRKMKRDKSIVFANIPEEGTNENGEHFGQNDKKTNQPPVVRQRPNHLPLKLKLTTREVTESGFNSINFDESDSFAQYIGKTSVCSTPMTENKVLLGNLMSICMTPMEKNTSILQKLIPQNSKSTELLNQTKLEDKTKTFRCKVSDYMKSPMKRDARCNSLTGINNTSDKTKNNIMSNIGFVRKKKSYCYELYDDSDNDEIDDLDEERKLYRTITDPTYPVFNMYGDPISKSLFEKDISPKDKQNFQLSLNEPNPQPKIVNTELSSGAEEIMSLKSETLDPLEGPSNQFIPSANVKRPNKIGLSLPIKPMNLDVDDDEKVRNNGSFEPSILKPKMQGIQLTPLMSKLSILAANDERSSGFSSRDTTPGVELPPFSELNSRFTRRRSSFKYEDISEVQADMMQKVELLVCGQGNMVLSLIVEEGVLQKQDLVQPMFDICVSRLTRMESYLNEIMNVNMNSDKSEGHYSFIAVDSNWDTLQRVGPWSTIELSAVERMRNDLSSNNKITEMIIRCDESVIYGHSCGKSNIYYKQSKTVPKGLPAPSDLMGTISQSAKRRLERDHAIILQ